MELIEMEGVGPKSIIGIRLIKAVADRYMEQRVIRKDAINNIRDLLDYLAHTMRDKNREFFKIIYLDAKNCVNGVETLSEGSLTSSAVYPREVVQAALRHNAASVICAHNHPSGDPQPSQDDIAITQRLHFALKMVNINLHEHLIIAKNGYFSFAEKGYITRLNRELKNQESRLVESIGQKEDIYNG